MKGYLLKGLTTICLAGGILGSSAGINIIDSHYTREVKVTRIDITGITFCDKSGNLWEANTDIKGNDCIELGSTKTYKLLMSTNGTDENIKDDYIIAVKGE